MFPNNNQSFNPNLRTPNPNQQPDMGDPNLHNHPGFFNYVNNMQVPSPGGFGMWNTAPQQQMGFGMWNTTQQQFGFQNTQGSGSGRQNVDFETVDSDDEVVPETQVPLGDDKQKKKRVHRKKQVGEPRAKLVKTPWTTNEEFNLAKAWLEITEDPKCSNYQKEKTYWARIYELFLKLEEKPEGHRDPDIISAKWRKMRPLIQQFNQIYTRLTSSSARQSGANDAMIQANTQNEYRATHKQAFPYLAIWQMLRRSSKFDTVVSMEGIRGQPSNKRSKTSSSTSYPQSQGSDARCNINLNDFDEELEELEREDNPVQPLKRPMGRDRAKKAGQSSSSGVQVDYTTTFDKVTNKLDSLLQVTQERINLKKEHGDRKLQIKERKQRAMDLQTLAMDTSHLSGADLALAEQLKQEIRDRYNY